MPKITITTVTKYVPCDFCTGTAKNPFGCVDCHRIFCKEHGKIFLCNECLEKIPEGSKKKFLLGYFNWLMAIYPLSFVGFLVGTVILFAWMGAAIHFIAGIIGTASFFVTLIIMIVIPKKLKIFARDIYVQITGKKIENTQVNNQIILINSMKYLKTCLNCEGEVLKGTCKSCGAVYCPSCGIINENNAKYCNNCGISLKQK
ncbi:MAG: zinc-ribbon domain-containing protein [Candidatus Hodarchaeota archaeon]